MYRLSYIALAFASTLIWLSCGDNNETLKNFDFKLANKNLDLESVRTSNERKADPQGKAKIINIDNEHSQENIHVVSTFVEQAVPVPNDEDTNNFLAENFATEALRCGLEKDKTSCYNSSFKSKDSAVIELSDGWITITLLEHSEKRKSFGLIVESDRNDAVSRIRSAKLVAIGPEVENALVIRNDYLLDRSKTILQMQLPTDNIEYALSAIKEPHRDYRHLFHAMDYLSLYAKDNKPAVIDFLKINYEKFANAEGCEAYSYQNNLLDLLWKIYLEETELVRLVSNSLLQNKNTNNSLLAAMVLALTGENREEVYNKVKNAFKSEYAYYRLLAIDALNIIRKNANDENLIIARLSDSSQEVRAKAQSIITEWFLTDDHLPTLKSLLSSFRPEIIAVALRLIQRVPSNGATAIFIELLENSDPDLQLVAKRALKQRLLTREDLDPLEKLLNKTASWEVKTDVIGFISSIPNKEALHKLIAALEDSDSDVRESVKAALEQRLLTDDEIKSFTRLLNSHQWDTRAIAVKYLAKINTPLASAAIIPMLKDTDDEVRNIAMTSLKTLPINADMVLLFEPIIKSNFYDSRMYAAKILGRINLESASKLLLKLLFDNDEEVVYEAKHAIENHSFTDAIVEELNKKLNDDFDINRERAAEILGISKSCLAARLLKARLLKESNIYVKNSITLALVKLSHCST